MSRILKTAIRLHGKRASAALDCAALEPHAAQKKFLLDAVRRNAHTAFGRLHNFAGIRREEDFRRLVPVRDYEEFRPFVKRIMAGERAVLTVERPLMLTVTSGTTGEQKFIPVTRRSQRLEASIMRQWLYRTLLDHPSFLDHASVAIVSRAIEGHTASGLAFGSASGVTYKNVPWIIRRSQAIPYAVFETEDYDARYFLIARHALGAQVSFMATPNPVTLLRVAEICAEHGEKLVRAIHDGTLGLDLPAQPEIFATLAAQLRPCPARARELARVLKETGTLKPLDCWPALKLIACWTGGSVGAQARKLKEFYGAAAPLRDLGYIASEARITIPHADTTAAGILAVESNYYEFVPEEESNSANPRALLSHELEADRRYSILLTTPGGLWRYKINDIVEVAGFYKRAPLVAFVRKEGEMTNITGEKMHVNHFLLAMEEVRRKFDLAIEQFRATPDYAGRCYEIYLEMERDVSPRALQEKVLPEIDRALCCVNIEYAQKRQSKRLGAPRLHIMQRGWSERIRRQHITAGRRDTQYKWQMLCDERQLEDVRAITRTIEAGGKPATISSLEASAVASAKLFAAA